MPADSFAHLIGFENLEAFDQAYQAWHKGVPSLDPSWHAWFCQEGEQVRSEGQPFGDAMSLIQRYRRQGYLEATTSPLTFSSTPKEKTRIRDTIPKHVWNTWGPSHGILPKETACLGDLITQLECIYCQNLGVEYEGIVPEPVAAYLAKVMERERNRFLFSSQQVQKIYRYLAKAELFESFLHRRFPGQKRFSLEGLETLIPSLEFLLESALDWGGQEIYIAMAHRGRLNTLANIMAKPYAEIFWEFSHDLAPPSKGLSGDVKYHRGYRGTRTFEDGRTLDMVLLNNPSHLETINPALMGVVRARQDACHTLEEKQSMIPIMIHGDAALSGEGVVYETLQMSRLKGYQTYGVIHFVLNNEIGFTTLPHEGRSTLHCTDIAKTFGIPVFHVNGEDPETAVVATRMALEIRQKFGIDVMINLRGYRLHGHNESDEPLFTQPVKYREIREKQSVRQLYRQKVGEAFADAFDQEFRQTLSDAFAQNAQVQPFIDSWKPQDFSVCHEAIVDDVVSMLEAFPEGFTAHKKVQDVHQSRIEMLKSGTLDWALGELLGCAALLRAQVAIRLTGQDVARGTFSHRHMVIIDQETGESHVPLQAFYQDMASIEIHNSPLHEMGALGFEYGYSLTDRPVRVIWEAQFGDFANMAQPIFDQYISSCEDKWGQSAPLTILLPHGYEGQGPEHSSARLERFLQLCGRDNMRVVQPTTPSQMYACLVRPGHDRKPWIVMTPKTLLRHPLCTSRVEECTGEFHPLLEMPSDHTKRVIFCSGKIAIEWMEECARRGVEPDVMVRLEQLYPFPKQQIASLVKKYSQSVFWYIQDEPENMGALRYVQQMFFSMEIPLVTRSRPEAASPAVGSYTLHREEQNALWDSIFIEELAWKKS